MVSFPESLHSAWPVAKEKSSKDADQDMEQGGGVEAEHLQFGKA